MIPEAFCNANAIKKGADRKREREIERGKKREREERSYNINLPRTKLTLTLTQQNPAPQARSMENGRNCSIFSSRMSKSKQFREG